MEDIIVIRPGHYCSRDTINSESKQIIRVLGPSKKRDNYWVIDDGRELSDYIIDNDYIALDTAATKDNKKVNNNLFNGFKSIANIEHSFDNIDTTPPIEVLHTNVENTKVQTTIVQPVTDRYSNIRNLVSKAHIDNLNDASMKKHGIAQYKPTELEFTIKLSIPYELNKLAQISELFELDTKEIAHMIEDEVQYPHALVTQHLLEWLNSPNTIKQTNPVETPIIQQEVKEQQPVDALVSIIRELKDEINTLKNQKIESVEAKQIEMDLNSFAEMKKSKWAL